MIASNAPDQNGIIIIQIPLTFKRRGGRREVILPPGARDERPATPVQLALARAYRWQKMLDSGEVGSISELATQIGADKSLVAKQLRLAQLAPDIVEAILKGTEPEGTSLMRLFEAIPLLWEDQRKLYGLPTAAS